MIYRAFDKQIPFHRSHAWQRGLFAGKRGGKTEAGAVEAIVHAENKVGWKPNPIDPPIGVIIAPTGDMLRRLSLKKFLAYAAPFKPQHHKTHQEITWPNGHLVYGISAEKPQRLEGLKANWIWIDEVFQVSEQLYLEAVARVSDTEGRLWCTGSLGTQYTNPKAHWAYKHFKQSPMPGTEVFEWTTADNPFFPRERLALMRDTMDPRTYRQMFTIDWDVPGTALVYDQLDAANIMRGYKYRPDLETFIVIDWGWAHNMAVLFIQYDPKADVVYVFDEIVGPKIKLEDLWTRIQAKITRWGATGRVTGWFCDIAGNQEREQTGRSNVAWFKLPPRNITIKYRTSAVTHGVTLVRGYVRNGIGQARLFIDEVACPKTLDCLKNYSYPEKNGVILNENPLKKDDDPADALRYFFVNRLDWTKPTETFSEFNRWTWAK